MTDIPDEAVEAAARALYERSTRIDPWNQLPERLRAHWRAYVTPEITAAAPIIAAQATADLRARIEALRNEWHKGAQGRFENGRHPDTLGSCADALDSLIGGAK